MSSGTGGRTLLLGPMRPANLDALRELMPWMRPRPLGTRTSAGFGDRLGLATQGHVRALRAAGGGLALIFAQQSIREMERTGRSPRKVLDDATWGAFAEDWQEGFAADADHLKTAEDVDACVAAGYLRVSAEGGTLPQSPPGVVVRTSRALRSRPRKALPATPRALCERRNPMSKPWTLDPDRLFDPNPARRSVARSLYTEVEDLPIVGPHGHVPPALLADPDATLGTPAELFIIPDHYVFRMLYSQGVPMEDLGVPTVDDTSVEKDHRRVWQRFCENFHHFRATPTGLWLSDELVNVFGVTERLTGENAQGIYDHLQERLASPEYTPRALFETFGVEVLCTTDAATDTLEHHATLRAEGWGGRVRPTFRPDAVIDLSTAGWRHNIDLLSQASGTDVIHYRSFLEALQERRSFFKEMGAVATDHSATTPHTERLSETEAQGIFARALSGESSGEDAARFTANMLVEMAGMSVEDGLVMQLHAGSLRNHNTVVHRRFGLDSGADIPIAADWTRGLRAILDERGNDPRFRLVVFGLDEAAYSRELAPLAGHYPALLLGAPWWFFDSPLGMRRYLDAVIETAGLYNAAGFNDDTRAFASIPSRHDVWRRITCDWLAGMVVTGVVDGEEAGDMAREFAYGLAKRAYGFQREPVGRA